MKWIAESTTMDETRLIMEGKRRGHSNMRSRCLKVKIDSLEAINLHSLRVESSSPCSSPHLPATLFFTDVFPVGLHRNILIVMMDQLTNSVKSPIPFQAKLNNTYVYCLNSKVHPGMMAVKGEKELSK